jgi:CubicO group peptidase (beta-lactamase class C family)
MNSALPSLVTALFLISCQQVRKERPDQEFAEKVDSLFKSAPDFSGVVYVGERGVPKYHKAFGYRDFRTQERNDTASVFELASLSKQFTAMTIMMLKEKGKLSYDDPVSAYIPELPYPGITVRHLLTHTSGLPDYQAVMDQYWDKTKVAGNDDNIAHLIRYKPSKHFSPGEKYEYSNTGYMLLATIAEKTSGKDFITLCREKIFTPLNMQHAGIRTNAEKLDLQKMAWGHLFVAEKMRYVQADSFPQFNYCIWLGNRKGPGRVSATTSDLRKWDEALYTERLVKKQTLHEAFTPANLTNNTTSPYGFGWSLPVARYGKTVMHTGDNPGYKTIIIRYLDTRRIIIILCNNAHQEFDELADGLVALLHDE